MPTSKGSNIKAQQPRNLDTAYKIVDGLSPQNGGSKMVDRDFNSKDTQHVTKSGTGTAAGPVTKNL